MTEKNLEEFKGDSVVRRLVKGLCIFGIVYFVSLYVAHPLVRPLIRDIEWIGSGDITQFSLLAFSVLLIFLTGGGHFARFGFRSASIRETIKAVLTAIGFSVVTTFLFVIAIASGGGMDAAPDTGSPAVPGNVLKTVISVWVIASICEEIFYRGFLLNYLAPLKDYGLRLWKGRISLPVTICAVTFGLGHLCLLGMLPGRAVPPIIVSCTVCGAIAGYFAEKTGSLIPSIGVHMTFNIVGMVIPSMLFMLFGSG